MTIAQAEVSVPVAADIDAAVAGSRGLRRYRRSPSPGSAAAAWLSLAIGIDLGTTSIGGDGAQRMPVVLLDVDGRVLPPSCVCAAMLWSGRS
jgi:hypothetical protein